MVFCSRPLSCFGIGEVASSLKLPEAAFSKHTDTNVAESWKFKGFAKEK